jgi:pyruvate/2-oxoglutarate dehydrogenase complex dihydrolipoamide dehydrogenase (E3) component
VHDTYDLVIVGGGAAGINAARAALALGARVALVDRGPLGGTCVNRG